MIRLTSFLLALTLSTSLYADEMSDALAAQQKKDYQQAKQIFSKLANEGSVKAQEELADMYWFGDGMPVDLSQAQYWFTKAAQAGSSKAQASLAVMKARVDRKDEISYYTTQFDGGKLQFSNSGCTKPTLPAVSKSNSEVKKVTADIQSWSDCYNNYIKMFMAAPRGLAIVPQDLLRIMSDEDRATAKTTIDKKLAGIVVGVKAAAEEVNQNVDAWKKATESYIIQANGGKAGMTVEEFEVFQRYSRSQSENQRQTSEVRTPPAPSK